MEEIRFEEQVLASLFHDLGKIAQRAGAEDCLTPKMDGQLLPLAPGGWYSHKHAWYTQGDILKLKYRLPEGLNEETIAEFAAHHKPSNVAKAYYEGDRISSGADELCELKLRQGFIHRASMLSIFSSVASVIKKSFQKPFFNSAHLNLIEDIQNLPSETHDSPIMIFGTVS